MTPPNDAARPVAYAHAGFPSWASTRASETVVKLTRNPQPEYGFTEALYTAADYDALRAKLEAAEAQGDMDEVVEAVEHDVEVWTLIDLITRCGGVEDQGEQRKYWTLDLNAIYALEGLLSRYGVSTGYANAAISGAPAGMVLVPREPTTAMLLAAANHDYYAEKDPTWRSLWLHMIAAALKEDAP